MRTLATILLLCGALLTSGAQTDPAGPPTPRDYRGVRVRMDGIFVTPVPNAPFTATVEIVSHEKLPDGSEHVVKTTNRIARSSSGRIRNERRQLVPASFQGEPQLLSAHLYDPGTRQNIFFEPATHLARFTILPAPLRTPSGARPPEQLPSPSDVVVSDLGSQQMEGVELKGTRKVRTVPATLSGTGKPVTVTDEYWYSPDLSIYLIIRHDDPRTGEQLVAVSGIERAEPPAELMSVPDGYKMVDETPLTSPAPAQ